MVKKIFKFNTDKVELMLKIAFFDCAFVHAAVMFLQEPQFTTTKY